MNLLEFFDTINLNEGDLNHAYKKNQFVNSIEFYHNQDISAFDIAILGVGEDRNSITNQGCALAPNQVRKYLYQLMGFNNLPKIIDLGNFKIGLTVNDTYFALSSIVEDLIKKNVIPIIIGGSQDLTYANFLAYKNLEQTINLVTIDSKFDLGDTEEEITSTNYLTKIILHQPNYLFNFSNIGYQTYFIDKEEVTLMSKLFFDTYRLGHVQKNIEEVEPIVRNADVISFDISAIRQAEAPGNKSASPNGFYGEQACQISRYAGLSDKLTSIGFYETNPEKDINGQTAHSVAQMIWYFIDGYANRKNDFPIGSRKTYLKYIVNIQNGQNEIIFYKSDKSERWWMDVPYPSHEKIKYERHLLVPCSYNDYKTACNNEVPDRWWQTFQKLL
ncbi:MAG: arginase [Flavobacteriales bacterium CG_4_10_14_0_2_um_filter_32_8]|nr:MAG: arginase [Flavobacteriales bacterium CG_4_10_14_0_2_um_filter_32_8]PJB14942.1 MAG: arginase [Flavobacteriales bacterium CG_4_9_14_3_um_filter_32_8]